MQASEVKSDSIYEDKRNAAIDQKHSRNLMTVRRDDGGSLVSVPKNMAHKYSAISDELVGTFIIRPCRAYIAKIAAVKALRHTYPSKVTK